MKYYNGAGKPPVIGDYTMAGMAEFAEPSKKNKGKKITAGVAGVGLTGAAATRYGLPAAKTGIRVGKMAGGEKGLSRGTKVAAISAGRKIRKDAKAVGKAAVSGINSIIKQGYKTPNSLRTKIGSKLSRVGAAAMKVIRRGK